MAASWRTRRASASRIPPTAAPELDLADLREKLADMPDLRIGKVESIRRALALESYDEESVLDEVLLRLEEDMAALSGSSPSSP